MRQLVTESVLLALLGGICGLLVASLATQAAFISPHRVGTTAETTQAYWQIYNRTLEHLARAPGIVSAAGGTDLPYAFNDSERPRGRQQIRRRGGGSNRRSCRPGRMS